MIDAIVAGWGLVLTGMTLVLVGPGIVRWARKPRAEPVWDRAQAKVTAIYALHEWELVVNGEPRTIPTVVGPHDQVEVRRRRVS